MSSLTATPCRWRPACGSKLAALQAAAGRAMANWYDQSVLVTQSAGSVRDAVLIGLVLAALVLFAFLRSLRVTLVAVSWCRQRWLRPCCCSPCWASASTS